MAYADLGEVQLFFTDEGDGDPPILMVHGFSCDGHDWMWQIPHFAANHIVSALAIEHPELVSAVVSVDPGYERSFARLCGAAPLDASSGKQQRHRLSRGGDRQANSALWRIVITRLSYDPATRDYLERRCAEGKTKTEAIRCLKRYVAREVYAYLPQQGPA